LHVKNVQFIKKMRRHISPLARCDNWLWYEGLGPTTIDHYSFPFRDKNYSFLIIIFRRMIMNALGALVKTLK